VLDQAAVERFCRKDYLRAAAREVCLVGQYRGIRGCPRPSARGEKQERLLEASIVADWLDEEEESPPAYILSLGGEAIEGERAWLVADRKLGRLQPMRGAQDWPCPSPAPPLLYLGRGLVLVLLRSSPSVLGWLGGERT